MQFMDKNAIYELLEQKGIWHEITEHIAVFNMEEVAQIELPYPEAEAKNLFIRDDKKRNFYLITVRGNKRVDLKKFKQEHGTRSLQFASAEMLMDMMGLIPGAVTPMGMLNDEECRIQWFLDREFLDTDGLMGVHPNDNAATVWIKAADLVELIREHGNTVNIVEI